LILIPSDRRKQLILILVITLAPLLLFAQKPFHIDDSAFLEIARNILDHPFDPFHGSVALVDHDYEIFKRLGKTPNTFESMSHPPLVPYMMAGVIKLRGGVDEFALHLAFVIFPLVTAASGFYIAERCTNSPFVATLLFVTCPIFMINSQNLMTDIPALSLMLCSLAVFIYSVEHQRISCAVLSGVVGGLAGLTRYPAMVTPILLIIYSIITRKGLRLSIIAAVAASAVYAIWFIQNFAIYSVAHIWASYKFYKSFYAYHSFGYKDTLIKAASNFSAIGGCAFLGAVFVFFKRKNRFSFSFISSIVVSAILVLLLKKFTLALEDYSSMQFAAFCVFAFAGIYFAVEAFRIVITNADNPIIKFLGIWLLLTLVPALFLLPFGTGRYMLPALFPLILILVADPEWDFNAGRRALSAILIVTFIFGLILSWTDFELALTYKVFAQSIRENYKNAKIWFIGEWGFRYYMKQQGGQYLLSDDTRPAPGDIIVKPQMAGLHQMAESVYKQCVVYDPFVVFSVNPLRILSLQAKAGFYSSGFGLLPYSVSKVPLENFEIYKIFSPESGKSPISKDLQGTSH
jgi:hypothetical protein